MVDIHSSAADICSSITGEMQFFFKALLLYLQVYHIGR